MSSAPARWIAVLSLLAACTGDSGGGGPDGGGSIPPDPDDLADAGGGSPDSCGPTGCDGCCDGDACMSGTSPSACGGGGAACQVCEPGFVCEAAACSVDRTSRWDVLAEGATVYEDNAGGTAWDPSGGLPDPYAVMETSDGIEELEGSTGSPDNTLEPSWNQVVLEEVPAAALLDSGVRTTLYDHDPIGGSDSMGTCQTLFDDADFTGESLTVDCPFDPDAGVRGWTLRLRLIRK